MAARKYQSRLRAQQARDTRERILEGAARATFLDFGRVTHAAVARSAGVAERTVYRHFPTVAALHDAFVKFQDRRFSRDQTDEFTIDELPETYGHPESIPKHSVEDAPVFRRLRERRFATIIDQPPGCTLQELRKSCHRSQAEVAATLEVRQLAVSRLERRRDMRLGSLRRYVAALGGELHVIVRLRGRAVRLQQWD